MKYTQREIVPAPTAPLWYVTFSDMMTLLLACFVLLLSFSTISKTQFGTASRSLNGALGASQQAIDMRPTESKEINALYEAAREFRRQLQVEGRAQDVAIEYDGHSLRLILFADRFFNEARNAIRPDALPVLQLADSLIAQVPRAALNISGHADGSSLTALDAYADNIHESYELAQIVYAALRGMPGGIDMHHPVLEGSGDARSIATAATEDGRRKNRRVEITVQTVPAAGGQAS